MKKLIIIFSLLIIFINSFSQTGVFNRTNGTVIIGDPRLKIGQALYIPSGISPTLNGSNRGPGMLFYSTTDTSLYVFDSTSWNKIGTGGGGNEIISAGPFTTNNTNISFDPGSNLTAGQILQKVFYGLKPPTSSISGGTILEYIPASTVSQTLNWTAGRQINTAPLSTIVVAGVSQSFSQPSLNSSVSGTQTVNVPANITTSYNNVVTSSDAQTVSSTTTFSFQPRKYYGWISDTTGIASGGQDAVIKALTSTLSNSKNLGSSITPYNTGNPSGTQFFVYAYVSSLGAISSISFNGFSTITAMNIITKTFTTANGYTANYTIIYNKNIQNSSSDVIFQ